MTPTEIEEINRKFAEEVMGWRLSGPFRDWVDDTELTGFCDKPKQPDYYFDPYHRWEHAWLGLKKFDGYELQGYHGLHRCIIRKTNLDIYVGEWTDTAQAAICIAVLEAQALTTITQGG